MSSNNKGFRPGALVMLLRAANPHPDVQRLIGTPRTLGQQDPDWGPGNWRFDPPVFSTEGRAISWSENDMRLIDPDNGEDEMLIITGKPVTKDTPVTTS